MHPAAAFAHPQHALAEQSFRRAFAAYVGVEYDDARVVRRTREQHVLWLARHYAFSMHTVHGVAPLRHPSLWFLASRLHSQVLQKVWAQPVDVQWDVVHWALTFPPPPPLVMVAAPLAMPTSAAPPTSSEAPTPFFKAPSETSSSKGPTPSSGTSSVKAPTSSCEAPSSQPVPRRVLTRASAAAPPRTTSREQDPGKSYNWRRKSRKHVEARMHELSLQTSEAILDGGGEA